MRERIVAGNWKLHGDRAFARSLLDDVARGRPTGCMWRCSRRCPTWANWPRRTCRRAWSSARRTSTSNEQGAFTGEVSARMLLDVGCRYALVGHSERRHFHDETSEDWWPGSSSPPSAQGLIPMLCVGETLHQREAGQTEWAIERQLAPVLATAGAPGLRQGGAGL